MDKAGIILLDKSAGRSSAQAIAAVKKKLNLSKIGHSGTLDPFATGLLICLTGRATKLADHAVSGQKRYSGTILFGIRTDTDDITGAVLEDCPLPADLSILPKLIAEKFTGTVSQVPPKYSALKIAGERAYDLARAGKDFVVPERQVEVAAFSIKIISESEVSFDISCSAGTYIRALARDLGAAMGSQACLKTLRREASWPFNVAGARTIEAIDTGSLIGWDQLFPGACRITLDPQTCQRVANGYRPVLAQIQEQFSSVIRDFTQVLFFAEKEGRPLGLLINNDNSLEFGFVDF